MFNRGPIGTSGVSIIIVKVEVEVTQPPLILESIPVLMPESDPVLVPVPKFILIPSLPPEPEPKRNLWQIDHSPL